jgi:hypothetical protein
VILSPCLSFLVSSDVIRRQESNPLPSWLIIPTSQSDIRKGNKEGTKSLGLLEYGVLRFSLSLHPLHQSISQMGKLRSRERRRVDCTHTLRD